MQSWNTQFLKPLVMMLTLCLYITKAQYTAPNVFVNYGSTCGDGQYMAPLVCMPLSYSIYGGGVRYWTIFNHSTCEDRIIIEWYQHSQRACTGEKISETICWRNTCCVIKTPFGEYAFNNDMGVLITSTQTILSTFSIFQTVIVSTTSTEIVTRTSTETSTSGSCLTQLPGRRYCNN